jgi:hypothetical protein
VDYGTLAVKHDDARHAASSKTPRQAQIDEVGADNQDVCFPDFVHRQAFRK